MYEFDQSSFNSKEFDEDFDNLKSNTNNNEVSTDQIITLNFSF